MNIRDVLLSANLDVEFKHLKIQPDHKFAEKAHASKNLIINRQLTALKKFLEEKVYIDSQDMDGYSAGAISTFVETIFKE